MQTIFYDSPHVRWADLSVRGIFLAGPSAVGVERTPWRLEALRLLEAASFDGIVVVPEFERGGFRREFFDDGHPSTVPGMTRASECILEWETERIDSCAVLLAWMPFVLAPEGDPASLPGFTTRAEVARATARDRHRPMLALGMPPGALSSGHIRYHAHRRGLTIHQTLAETIEDALQLAKTAALMGHRP